MCGICQAQAQAQASSRALQPYPTFRARRPSCGISVRVAFFLRSSRRTHDPVRGFACPPQWTPMFLACTTTARSRMHTRTHGRGPSHQHATPPAFT